MAVFAGPKVAPLDNLILALDAGNGKSYSKYSTVRVLVVGGGGGGGMDMGGGGGGGGVVYEKTQPVYGDIIVTVGRGGYGGPAASTYRTDGAGPQPGGHQYTIPATAGLSSSFGDLIALGGGFGGSSYRGYTPGIAGGAGASGGGSSGYNDNAGTFYGGAGTVGQGFRGGNSTAAYYSGGGGGAGGPGADSTNQPNGGSGVYNDITGTGYYWGGGGGGSSYSLSTGGNGGIGGGGGGAVGSTTGGAGYNAGSAGGGGSPNSQTNYPGGNAGANTGGGGGGGSHYNSNNKGGEGGSGIVVVRYSGAQNASGGNIITTVSGDTVHIFTSSGVFSPSGFTNTKSANTNLLSWSEWTAGAGGTSFYSQNGNTGENQRVTDTDPWGSPLQVVWETRASGDGGADGGWNTSTFSIDRTKLYRYAMWVRRTSSTSGGTFYFGMYAGPSAVLRNDNSAAEGNPYWVCSGTSILTQNQWYLVVGHVYPNQTAATTRHADTGFYTITGGTTKVMDVNSCNIGQDLKWNSDTTYGQHRAYHYYCADATTRLQFYQPRVDLCDGSEPSISELLANDEFAWYDMSMNRYTAYMSAMTRSNLVTIGGVQAYETNDTNNQGFRVPSFPFPQAGRTYEIWIRSKSYSIGWQTWFDDGGGERILFGTSSNAEQIYPDLSFAANLQVDTWYQLAYTMSGASGSTAIGYVNGVQIGTGTYSSTPASGSGSLYILGDFGSEVTSCYCSIVRLHNRALSATEILQNFNANRGRFGI
jgi:hypothetical protein